MMIPSKVFLFLKSRANNKSLFGELGYFDSDKMLYNIAFTPEDLKDGIFNLEQEIFATPTLLHEKVHWFQHIGSSIGFFKSFLTCAQYNLIKQFISNIDFETPLFDYFQKKEAYINSSMSKSNIFPINPDIDIDIDAHEVNYVASVMWNWLYFEYINYLIEGNFDKGSVTGLASIRECLKVIYSGAFHYYKQLGYAPLEFNLYYKKFKEMAQDDDFFFIELEDNRCLGTEHIFESSARYTDMVKLMRNYLQTKLGNEEQMNNFIDEYILQEPYNTLYNIFERFVDISDKNIKRVLFLIVCDYSLNPVCPPLFDTPDLYAQGTQYIFPQIRFIALSAALKRKIEERKNFIINANKDEVDKRINGNPQKVKEIDFFNSIKDYNEFVEAVFYNLKEETGFLTPTDIAKKFIEIYEKLDIDEDSYADFYSYYLKMFYKSCKIRLECPLFFVDLGTLEALNRELYLELCSRLKPPVIGLKNKFFPHASERDYVFYVQKLISNTFLRDIITSKTSDMSFINNFTGVDRNYVREYLKKVLKRNIDKLINI